MSGRLPRVEFCSTQGLVQVFLPSGWQAKAGVKACTPYGSSRFGFDISDSSSPPSVPAVVSSPPTIPNRANGCQAARFRTLFSMGRSPQVCVSFAFADYSFVCSAGVLLAMARQESLTMSRVSTLYRSLSRESPSIRLINISVAIYPMVSIDWSTVVRPGWV
jgi:hypothetical protein